MGSVTGVVGKYGGGGGTSQLYVVEARSIANEPEVVNGVLLTSEWRRINVSMVPVQALAVSAASITVPASPYPEVSAARQGLLTKESAFALAIRFMVDSGERVGGYSAGHAHMCVETRLVEVAMAYHYSVTEVGVCEPLSLFESLRYLKSTPRELLQAAAAVDPQAGSTGNTSTRDGI